MGGRATRVMRRQHHTSGARTVCSCAAMIVGVRQALDYHSTRRAIAVCAIGFPVYAVFLLATLVFLGPWPV